MLPAAGCSVIFTGANRWDGVILIVANLLLLGVLAGFGIRSNRAARVARHDLSVQAWHLGQLLPADRVSVR